MADQELGTLPDFSNFDVEHALARDYARALYSVYSATARFRARLCGFMTPAIIWPHSFRPIIFVFCGSGSDEQNDPHMNFGFAPYSATIDRPYLYFYAWPIPEGIMFVPLPEPAQWFDEDWTGIIVDYDKLRQEDDPEYVVEMVFLSIFNIVYPAMDGA